MGWNSCAASARARKHEVPVVMVTADTEIAVRHEACA
jgi:hypothetical protein